MNHTATKEYSRPWMLNSAPVATLAVAVVYAVVAKVSFLFTIPPGNVSPIFPAAGIALAAVMILGRNGLVGVWLGSFVANTISFFDGTVSSVHAVLPNLLIASVIGIGAMSGAGAGAFLVRRFCKDEHPLHSGWNVLMLVTVGALGCCMVSPTFGVVSLSLGGYIPWERFGYSWITWWAGDVTGAIVAAPLILAWHHSHPFHKNPWRTMEAAALGGVTLLLCLFVFFRNVPFTYGLIPLLLWAAFRFGMRGASTTAAAIAVLATIGTSHGGSPFLRDTVNESLLFLHSFLDVTIVCALFLAGVLAERKRAEEALRQSEATLQSVFQSTPVGICIMKNRVFQSANACWCKSFGYPEESLLGKTTRMLYESDKEYDRVGRELYTHLQEGNLATTETRLRRSDGTSRDVILTAAPLQADDLTAGTVVTIHDVTERKRAAMELQESETHYRFLFEHNPMPMLIYERGTLQMLAVNEAFVRHYGYSREEALALHLTNLYPEEEKTKIAELIPHLHGHANVGEWRHRKRDGSFITIVAFSHDLEYQERNARVAVMTDITDRKRVEEALRQSEEQFRMIMENLADLVAVLDLDGRRLYNSPSYQGILGDPDKLRGTSSFDQVHPEDRERVEQSFRETVRTGIGQRLEYRMVGQDGKARHIESQGSVIRDAQGRVSQVVVVSRDITERRQAEEAIRELNVSLERRVAKRTAELAVAKERAEEADRVKSAFLATMSHELRTPLNSIIGFTGIILQGLAGPLNDEQTKQLTMVQNSARHLLALINDVLDISKIEAGQLEIHAEPFDLLASLEKVAALVKPMADKKGLPLQVILSPDVGQVVSDRLRVEQVLLNLLNNAVKFTEHGEVTLEARLLKGYVYHNEGTPRPAVRLCVTDTGIGIQPEDMEKIFQPFRQIDSGPARRHEGTGLGLTICRHLADLLGGEISAKSTWGQGSTFTFILPLEHKNKP